MGFKTEQFVKNVDENLICSICHEVFEDPVSCKDGHTFCKNCIHEWLDANRTCPLSNSPLTKEQLVRLLTVNGIIDNLEVYCQTPAEDTSSQAIQVPEARCEWVGKLENLAEHKKTCAFQVVQCSHVQCNKTMQRREVEPHEMSCDFRKVECEKCEMVLLQHKKEKHLRDKCWEAMISCPNKCKDNKQQIVEFKRAFLDYHLSKVCPKTQVDCPCKEQGCVLQVERQDVEKHVQENMVAHMMLLAKECSLLRKQNQSLAARCSFLKDELRIKDKQLLNACSYTWGIIQYPKVAENCPNGSFIKSPCFWLHGHKWCIYLFPNGKQEKHTGFLSVLVRNVDEDSQASSDTMPNMRTVVTFRLSVKSQKPGTDDASKQQIQSTDKNFGFLKLLKASDALSQSYCDESGLLEVQFILHHVECFSYTVVPKQIQAD